MTALYGSLYAGDQVCHGAACEQNPVQFFGHAAELTAVLQATLYVPPPDWSG